MQTQMTYSTQAPVDVLQQFDQLLKNHSILVSDRENLTKLFENIVDLCTQMTKAKLKAAGSPVAGRADCLVFPDLSAGNISIKAIQQFGNVRTYGNILLGLRLPAAEISRGADEGGADEGVGLHTADGPQGVAGGEIEQPPNGGGGEVGRRLGCGGGGGHAILSRARRSSSESRRERSVSQRWASCQ